MLDGLLGRGGFYSKCKSLIKLTRTRIDVVKRKRSATQKFLKKDIADLLANGLDTNAFGRVDGLIAELLVSSCYDFIDHVCELVLKHLPVLQKLRECPEDCREAVASLMFAAARFSDLPELRELRDLFQERYGSSLEYFVNQKLVENITPKPPSIEKKVQLMQEIALEFSIRWDSRGFEERMSNPSATGKNQRQNPVIVHAAQSKGLTPAVTETVQNTVKDEVAKKKSEATYQNREREVDRHQTEKGKESILGRRDDLKQNASRVPELPTGRYNPSYREATIQKREDHDISFQRREPKSEVCNSKEKSALDAVHVGTSRGKGLETVDSQHKRDRHREHHVSDRDLSEKLLQQKTGPAPVNNGINFRSNVDNEHAEDNQVRSMRNREDAINGFKSNIRSAIPPPYVKPRNSKHKTVDLEADQNDTLTFNPGSNSNRSEKVPTKPDLADSQDKVAAPENVDGQGRFTEIYYRDTSSSDITPKRRSHRKKHSRSLSTQDDKLKGEVAKEEERVVRRVSTSRRKHESRKGLQILFDDDHYKKKDDEEKMIDNLLLHYSKKPSSGDPGRPRRKTNSETNGASKSPYHKAVHGTNVDEGDSTPTTSRSFSLPSQHVTEPEPQKKVFARASSFQQDTPAKHVHPKLPNYDDLAARFAALRSSKD